MPRSRRRLRGMAARGRWISTTSAQGLCPSAMTSSSPANGAAELLVQNDARLGRLKGAPDCARRLARRRDATA